MNIVAVIVTYNRLALLKTAIHSVETQTTLVSKILVINNGSTDGTEGWLQTQPHILTITQENGGGAFGFYRGIKEAYNFQPDWIWLMDGDSLPQSTCLEAMVQKLDVLGHEAASFGFLSSKVLWTDGAQHNKNKTPLTKTKLSELLPEGMQLIRSGSFVSILLSRKAIESSGLPLKEFFIWYDDVEYTQRIIRKGFKGALVEDSIVVHKTPDNLNNNIFIDAPEAQWKYFYGIRNWFYLRRKKKGVFIYFLYVLKYFFYMPLLILIRRKNAHWGFIKAVWKGTRASLFFHPKPEAIQLTNPAQNDID